MPTLRALAFAVALACSLAVASPPAPEPFAQSPRELPNGKLLAEVPGHPRAINNFPTTSVVSPDGRFAVFLNSGFGAYTSGQEQSLTVLDLATNELRDFPDERLGS